MSETNSMNGASRGTRRIYTSGTTTLVVASALAALGLGACGEMTLDEAETADVLQRAVSSPNDPDFNKQWSANNTGQPALIDVDDAESQNGHRSVDLRLLRAWDTTQGSSNVIVAVVEQFDADLSHPDLVGTRWVNTAEIPNNGIDDDHNGYRDDIFGYDFTDNEGNVSDDLEEESGHATHISGIVGAKKGNALGISGVAPGARVMHLRASANNAAAMIKAINYAKSKGAKIVNLSQGGGPAYNVPAVRDKIAAESAILFVCSAGNGAVSNFNYPSSYPSANILAVASIDNLGVSGRSSNFGEQHVDIAAPGVGVYSTLPGGGYGWKNGTSQAAANVSGVAALLLSSEPALKPTQIITRLKGTGMRVTLLDKLMQTPAIVDAEAALATTLNVNLTAISAPGRITLTWNAVAGATRYQVERDGTLVDNQQSRTFVHANLAVDSRHVYRVRAQVNGAYGKWTYRVLKAASNEPVVETLQSPVQPPRDSSGKYLPNLEETYSVGKANSKLVRLHFTRIALSDFDYVSLNFGPSYFNDDALVPGGFWTQWFEGPSVTVSFTSDASGSDFGFKIDQIEYVK